MKNACHTLLIVGLVLDIVAVVTFIIVGIVMIAVGVAGSATALANGASEEDAALIASTGIATGIVYILMSPIFIAGIVLSRIGMNKWAANEESIALGVCLIIFSFPPAGILYILCAVQNNRETVIQQ